MPDETPPGPAAPDEPAAPDGAQIERDIGDAIAGVLARHERGFVLNWIALIESAAPDGTRGLWTFTHADIQAWATAGLLTHALHLQQAQTAVLAGDLDDE